MRVVDGTIWYLEPRSNEATEIYRLDVEIFPTFATVAAGHTLRLALQTVDEPHANAPLPQGASSAGGTVTLHVDKEHQSSLILGVE